MCKRQKNVSDSSSLEQRMEKFITRSKIDESLGCGEELLYSGLHYSGFFVNIEAER